MPPEYADARKIIQKGVPIALATDLNPKAWIESMQTIQTILTVGRNNADGNQIPTRHVLLKKPLLPLQAFLP